MHTWQDNIKIDIMKIQNGRVETGLIWLRVGTSRRSLWVP
jgi:hypothetical protein